MNLRHCKGCSLRKTVGKYLTSVHSACLHCYLEGKEVKARKFEKTGPDLLSDLLYSAPKNSLRNAPFERVCCRGRHCFAAVEKKEYLLYLAIRLLLCLFLDTLLFAAAHHDASRRKDDFPGQQRRRMNSEGPGPPAAGEQQEAVTSSGSIVFKVTSGGRVGALRGRASPGRSGACSHANGEVCRAAQASERASHGLNTLID